jgi:16S rRNA (adenine1518-N6/adenine1519-N6)-dimethyltransferase
MRPRKSLGQHFLHDRNVIRRILDAVAPRSDEHFVEIGPGRGALTVPLLEVVRQLDVVEVDRALADELERTFAPAGLRVHHADALKFDFRTLGAEPGALRLAANLPYNISTPLLFHLLAHHDLFADLHVMLQREVVQRMTAPPGSRSYGRLTVALATRCRVEQLFVVKPGAFTPPPGVDSAVARLVPEPTRAARITSATAFDRVLTRAFSMRRKRLANSLKGLVSEAEIIACGIDPGVRPEGVPPEGYIELSRQLAAREGSSPG